MARSDDEIDVRYTIYDQVARVTLPLLGGASKRYDMVAQHFNDDKERTASGADVYIEVKNVGAMSTALKQDKQFIEFVATAYSAREAGFDTLGRDPGYEFMFAMKHPWDVKNYLKFATAEYVVECCAAHEELVPAERINEARAGELAAKLWVWIVPKRQDDMTMGRAHLESSGKHSRAGCRERRRDGPRRARRTRRTPQHRTRPYGDREGNRGTRSVGRAQPDGLLQPWAPDFVMSWPGAEAHTMSGSSGSPVLDRKLELVALHHGGEPGSPDVWLPCNKQTTPASYNEGIPIARIQAHLADQGLSWVFRGSG